jgi:hypothetical protein
MPYRWTHAAIFCGLLGLALGAGCGRGDGPPFDPDDPEGGDEGGGGSTSSTSSSSSNGSPSSSNGSSGTPGGSSSNGGSSGGHVSSSGSTSGTTSSSSSSGGSSSSSTVGVSDAATCTPTTTCGDGVTCDVQTNDCCLSPLAAVSCVSKSKGCQSGWASFGCASSCDCPSGQFCCGEATTTSAQTLCQTLTNGSCPGKTTSTMGSAQICEATSECQNGEQCIKQTCKPGTTNANVKLTMCGLQAGQPFNCTAGQ